MAVKFCDIPMSYETNNITTLCSKSYIAALLKSNGPNDEIATYLV